MKTHFLAFLITVASVNCLAQPYSPGVARHFEGAILPSDPSVLKSIAYDGRKTETVFDRQAGKRIVINAYDFTATWTNGSTSKLIVNPAIGGLDAARKEARKHAEIVGRLPCCLRSYIDEIVVHDGNAPYGGGNHRVMFYAQKTVEHERDGTLDEIVIHEAAHNLGQEIGSSPLWRQAQKKDNAFISKYAQEHPDREDVSESFLAWLILRYHRDRITDEQANTISSQIPARLRYFDNRDYDVTPVK